MHAVDAISTLARAVQATREVYKHGKITSIPQHNPASLLLHYPCNRGTGIASYLLGMGPMPPLCPQGLVVIVSKLLRSPGVSDDTKM